jgi:cytochrome c peroxidase
VGCGPDELPTSSIDLAARPAPPPVPNPPPLSSVAVPRPIGGDIVDQAAAVRLGKALFWDVQQGGDGQTSCASCHFRGGTDNRRTNTIHPGVNGTFDSGGVSTAGQTWNGTSLDRADDRIGSQGVVGGTFVSIDADPANASDLCTPDEAAPFFAERRVTGRNAPSVIGAVFMRDNFWDGRANNRFNGMNPFGSTGNNSEGAPVDLANASLASQAVGPPNNDTEMSCAGRAFNGAGSLATKMLARTPLAKQLVSPTDGVLGGLSNAPANGLATTYSQMITEAFGVALAADAENQFSRIYGQAVQAYEATLIPDQTPFDRFLAGDSSALTRAQLRGWNAFKGSAGCFPCHAGSELSDATVGFAAINGLRNVDGGDQGFHNIGVSRTSDDLGRAALGPGGVSFSTSGSAFDRGAFKTPSLRNLRLTAPYFHNGSVATIAEAVAAYSGNQIFFANAELASQMASSDVGSAKNDIVDFLTNAITDCRVERDRAPFDHPSLVLPNGTPLPATGAEGSGPCP